MGLKTILACSCSGMDRQAEQAFKITFPNTEVPVIAKGKTAVQYLADRYPNTNLERYLRAVARQKGRWAYYLSADDEGNITELYDLTTGKRVG